MSKVICIDAGHGGKDPGAVNGRKHESEAALAIALKLGYILEHRGYKVVYTRKDDTFVSLAKRCEISNRANADAFVAIHLNAATNKNAKGLETYRYVNCGSTTQRLASAIQKNLTAETGAKDRGVKQATFYVLKYTKAPAVLVETGFISNDSECKKLFTTDYQGKVATAIYKGIEAVLR